MQVITAVVRPSKLSDVVDALQRFGFRGLTVTEATGLGKQVEPPEMYRGRAYSVPLQHHAKIEIVASDLDVGDLVDVICKVATTGRIGDGKVWVTPVTTVVRLRDGAVGSDAL
jgi:nitrogen regulatory protein P-II 1